MANRIAPARAPTVKVTADNRWQEGRRGLCLRARLEVIDELLYLPDASLARTKIEVEIDDWQLATWQP